MSRHAMQFMTGDLCDSSSGVEEVYLFTAALAAVFVFGAGTFL